MIRKIAIGLLLAPLVALIAMVLLGTGLLLTEMFLQADTWGRLEFFFATWLAVTIVWLFTSNQ